MRVQVSTTLVFDIDADDEPLLDTIATAHRIASGIENDKLNAPYNIEVVLGEDYEKIDPDTGDTEKLPFEDLTRSG